jgi:Fur family ferric uptake transcriptional regulator
MKDVKFGIYSSLLRQAGFKATPGRLALLELFNKTEKPLSIKDIQKSLKQANLDQATIYRIISALESKGIIRQVDFQHGHAHYELTSREHHHHLICEQCGKIVDISKCDTSKVERQALKIGNFSKINKHSLEFFGICNICAKK